MSVSIRAAFFALPFVVLFGLGACSLAQDTTDVPTEIKVEIPEGDTLGNVHYITSEKILQATSLVKKGQSLPLGRITGPETPAWGDRSYEVEVMKLDPTSPTALSATDDKVTTHMGVGTQIDGFAHMGVGGEHYNGHRLEDFYSPQGVKIFGMESVPPIATRGVLLNIAALKGVDNLSASEVISIEDIKAALERQSLTIGAGDVVLFHMGWLSQAGGDQQTYIYKTPGIDGAAARYLGGLNVVAVGSDTGSLEVSPPPEGDPPNQGHIALLKENGVYLLENIATEVLVQNDVDEFMFVLAAPRFKGTIQAVVNPVAIY